MSQALQSNPLAMIESVARRMPKDAADDWRLLMRDIVLANLTALSPGGNLIQIGGAKTNSSAPPVGVAHTVTGANGVYSVAISNPPTPAGNPIYHEISYSPLKSFTQGVVVAPVTTATNFQIAEPGGNFFFRLRSSFDKKTWTKYTLSSTEAIDANYVGSAALEPGATLNQTNYAVVNSQSVGGNSLITVDGTGGRFTPYTAVRGSVQSLRPSATIVGTELGSQQFVGWDGSQFHMLSALADVFPDDLEPVGSVVVGSGVAGGGGVKGGNGGRLTAV